MRFFYMMLLLMTAGCSTAPQTPNRNIASDACSIDSKENVASLEDGQMDLSAYRINLRDQRILLKEQINPYSDQDKKILSKDGDGDYTLRQRGAINSLKSLDINIKNQWINAMNDLTRAKKFQTASLKKDKAPIETKCTMHYLGGKKNNRHVGNLSIESSRSFHVTKGLMYVHFALSNPNYSVICELQGNGDEISLSDFFKKLDANYGLYCRKWLEDESPQHTISKPL